ncbi:MAG: hypothetical protein Q4F00_02795 [bacterium]|nr:hypothetical protein [bacterium]
MEYTQAEIMAKMAKFVECSRKVKGLKDYLLGFRLYGNDREFLEEQIKRHDEAIEEVGRIYDEEMKPLIEEMAEYLNCHREDFEAIIAEERALAGEELAGAEEAVYAEEIAEGEADAVPTVVLDEGEASSDPA